ncbi:MAG: esterase-like activity of phytase family protein [Synechococcus sp.]|nr:esterase-like activity of phytase family protein [Synechococcus sp.]
MEIPPSVVLPCPLSAGWEVVEQRVLPPSHGGGFSAGAYLSSSDELWLLSDSPRGSIARWRGLKAGGLKGLEPLPPLPLSLPEPMDGEGLVLDGPNLWVASEGRRQPSQPSQPSQQAALLRYELASGALLQSLNLPPAWDLKGESGLRSNGGPESLTRVRGTGELLMAAEEPLQQDPPDRVRLLRWKLGAAGGLVPDPLPPLALPPGGWGLTDLLATDGGLLGLWRLFKQPDQWQARLVLYPPGAASTSASTDPAGHPLTPKASWNLLQLGLPADNWEVLLAAPPLADGRASLVLASDDNFNPLQRSHLARLVPRRLQGCPPLNQR